jgi:phage gpG-like protein
MAGVNVRLSPPLSFIHAQAGEFRRALDNLEPLWDRFEHELSQIETERWDTRGYGGWAPLAESTVAQKAAHGFPLDPLIRTGELRDSLTDPNRAGDKGPKQFSYGTDVPYAEYHQEGTDRMPSRPVLEIRLEDRRRLERETVSYVNEAAAKSWGRI